MPINDDQYLLKLKNTGVPNNVIAARMGITPEELDMRWASILRRATEMPENGDKQLEERFQIMCQQYQSLGESLKVMAGVLGTRPTQQQLLTVLSNEDPIKRVEKLTSMFLVLMPYIPLDDPLPEGSPNN